MHTHNRAREKQKGHPVRGALQIPGEVARESAMMSPSIERTR
jgi:hypothetical protein